MCAKLYENFLSGGNSFLSNKINGSEILMRCLKEQGVDTIFGYPGGAILNVYDKLYDHHEIKHILTAHEQGASHAADGYARATGKVGVCFATSGPGATNLTTGVATAYMDSSPVVFITCNVNRDLIGRDSFQEVDITGVTLPITKCSYIVSRVENLADTVREAFTIARSGRPGPVLIDIQKDATAGECEYELVTPEDYEKTSGRIARLKATHHPSIGCPDIDMNAVEKLAEMIDESQKPLLICGGGVVRSGASEEFRTLAHRMDSPVAITVMGGGAYGGYMPLKTGMIGMHGSQASNMACDACDLLIAVGCRFSDRVTLNPAGFAKNAKIVHIDIDASEIDKNIKTDLHIIGDAKEVLTLLLSKMKRDKKNDSWKKYVFSFKRETEYDNDPTHETLTPKEILSSVAEILPQDTVVTTDVGQHQMWAIQHFKFDYAGQLITSGGFGTMGFGLGAAIGAQVGCPEKTVLHVTGDGSFRMNCNELATEQYYKLPIITLIFNNSTLGMVRQWQHLIYHERYSQTTLDRGPDFAKLAEAYGVHGKSVHDVDALRDVLTEAVNSRSDGLGWVIDCKIDIDEMVRPMVSAGSYIANFMLD